MLARLSLSLSAVLCVYIWKSSKGLYELYNKPSASLTIIIIITRRAYVCIFIERERERETEPAAASSNRKKKKKKERATLLATGQFIKEKRTK